MSLVLNIKSGDIYNSIEFYNNKRINLVDIELSTILYETIVQSKTRNKHILQSQGKILAYTCSEKYYYMLVQLSGIHPLAAGEEWPSFLDFNKFHKRFMEFSKVFLPSVKLKLKNRKLKATINKVNIMDTNEDYRKRLSVLYFVSLLEDSRCPFAYISFDFTPISLKVRECMQNMFLETNGSKYIIMKPDPSFPVETGISHVLQNIIP